MSLKLDNHKTIFFSSELNMMRDETMQIIIRRREIQYHVLIKGSWKIDPYVTKKKVWSTKLFFHFTKCMTGSCWKKWLKYDAKNCLTFPELHNKVGYMIILKIYNASYVVWYTARVIENIKASNTNYTNYYSTYTTRCRYGTTCKRWALLGLRTYLHHVTSQTQDKTWSV